VGVGAGTPSRVFGGAVDGGGDASEVMEDSAASDEKTDGTTAEDNTEGRLVDDIDATGEPASMDEVTFPRASRLAPTPSVLVGVEKALVRGASGARRRGADMSGNVARAVFVGWSSPIGSSIRVEGVGNGEAVSGDDNILPCAGKGLATNGTSFAVNACGAGEAS
jgi:hypothetical protein